MKKLERLYFLIHGFCYAEMARGMTVVEPRLQPYMERENACAQKWQQRIAEFTETDALVVIPTHPACGQLLNDYLSHAVSALGDRVFLLDCPDALSPDFWQQGEEFSSLILKELQPAFVTQQLRCNNEELITHLHCLACAYQLHSLLQARGYTFDAATVLREAWGASFDGCVTKYTATLRRLLGLSQPIVINFNLTVPDASFLLEVRDAECVELSDNSRLFLFESEPNFIALFTHSSHSLEDAPTFVRLPCELSTATVLSKQGIRLWPQPEVYELPTAPPEYSEPAQQLVAVEDGCLRVPVSSGFVYRLAKAPAYIVAPEGMGHGEFRRLVMGAEVDGERS